MDLSIYGDSVLSSARTGGVICHFDPANGGFRLQLLADKIKRVINKKAFVQIIVNIFKFASHYVS